MCACVDKVFCVFRGHRFSWTKRFSQPFHPGDSPGYSTVGEASPSLRCLSLPHHALASEADEDLTISPYASYASLTERAPPIISGWLDKLSPQGCVCFTQLIGPGCWEETLSLTLFSLSLWLAGVGGHLCPFCCVSFCLLLPVSPSS